MKDQKPSSITIEFKIKKKRKKKKKRPLVDQKRGKNNNKLIIIYLNKIGLFGGFQLTQLVKDILLK